MKKERLKEALPGYGTTGHLRRALFAQETKLKFDQIPYRGGAPAMTDLLGDHVDFMIGTPQQMHAAGQGRQAQGLWHHRKGKDRRNSPTADSFVDLLGPKLRDLLLARLVRPGRNAGRGDQDAECGDQ